MSTAPIETRVATRRYAETAAVVPVACRRAWAMVGAKAPPRIAPMA
jgi:hypothetical protein